MLRTRRLILASKFTFRRPFFDQIPLSLKESNEKIINAAREDNIEEALEKFNAIKNQGLEVTREVYHSLIHCGARKKDFVLCDTLISEMENQGLEPNTKTFNIFINLCIQTQQISAIFPYYERMKSLGIVPDYYTYRKLIYGCLKTESQEKNIMVFFKDMIARKYVPSVNLFYPLICHYVEKEDHTTVFYLIDKMRHLKVKPDDRIKEVIAPLSDIFLKE